MSASFPRHLLKWLLGLNLSIPIKSVKRDFANGFLIAEICCKYFPHDFGLHSFENVTSQERRASNWVVLERVFKKLNFPVSAQLCAAVRAGQSDEAAEDLVTILYSHLEKSPAVESAPQTETLILDQEPEPQPAPLVDLHVPAVGKLGKEKGSRKLSSSMRRLSSKGQPSAKSQTSVKFADDAGMNSRPSTRGDKAATSGTQPADVVDPDFDIVAAASAATAASKAAAKLPSKAAVEGDEQLTSSLSSKERPEWRETGAKKQILGTAGARGRPMKSRRSSSFGNAEPRSAGASIPLPEPETPTPDPALGSQAEPEPTPPPVDKPVRKRKPAAPPAPKPEWRVYERKAPAKPKRVSGEAQQPASKDAQQPRQAQQQQATPGEQIGAQAAAPTDPNAGIGTAPTARSSGSGSLDGPAAASPDSPDCQQDATEARRSSSGQEPTGQPEPDTATDYDARNASDPSADTTAPVADHEVQVGVDRPCATEQKGQETEPSIFYDKQARKLKDFKPYSPESYLGKDYLDPKRSKYWKLGGLGMDDRPEAQAKREIAKQLKDMAINVRAQNLEAFKAAPPATRPAVKDDSPFHRAKLYSMAIPKPRIASDSPLTAESSAGSSVASATAFATPPELVLLEQQHAMDQQMLEQMRAMRITAS